MKKISSILLAVLILFTLCGCRETESITEKAIVEAIGLDFSDGRYTVSILSYKTQNSESQSDDTTELHKFSAPSISEAIAGIPSVSGKVPFYANNRVILINSGAAQNKLSDIIDFLSRDNQIRADSYLLYTDEKASDILDDTDLESSISNNYIFNLVEEGLETGKTEMLTAMKAKTYIEKGTGDIFMPVLCTVSEEKRIKIDGTVYFRKAKPAGRLSAEESLALQLIRNEINKPVITLSNGQSSVSVEITGASSKITPVKEDDGIKLKIEISGKCEISEKQGQSFQTDDKSVADTEAAVQKYFCEISEKFFVKTLSDVSDPAGIGRYIRKYLPEVWKSAEDVPSELLKAAKAEVTADITVVRTGQLK